MLTENAPFTYLHGLLQQYRIVDCWCGEDFESVVDQFLASPDDPLLSAELLESHDSYGAGMLRACTDLHATLDLDPLARRDALVVDVERFLERYPDEDARRTALALLDASPLVDFSEFWSHDGTEVDASRRATAFLTIVLADAKRFEVPKHLRDKSGVEIRAEAERAVRTEWAKRETS